jgi:hypothetical protein
MTITDAFTVGTDVVGGARYDGTIFLAGPIERVPSGGSAKLPRWRDEALQILDHRTEKLVIYNPQWDTQPSNWSYERQILWERRAMHHAMVRLFWIARVLPDLPGFTTNIEAGEYLHDEDTVFGAPPSAPHMRHLQTRCALLGKPWYTSLEQACNVAVGLLPNSGPKQLITRHDTSGAVLPMYCPEMGWPAPVTE